MTSAAPQPLDTCRQEDEMRASFMTEVMKQKSQKTGTNTKMFDNTEYTKKVEKLIECNDPEYKMLPADYPLWKSSRVIETIDANGSLQKTLVKVDSKTGKKKRYATFETLFDTIKQEHDIAQRHTGRLLTHKALALKFCNVTMEHVIAYIDLCLTCAMKKGRAKKGVVVKPLVSSSMGSRAQIDYIDMQSETDGEYKWIFNYVDHLTKFCVLLPGKTKTAQETAEKLVLVFSLLSAPIILQSDNGREFVNQTIEALVSLWPQCKTVHGKARHSQSQGAVERSNRDVEDILKAWKKDTKSNNWASALPIVQYTKNARYHSGIGRSPFMAMFGREPALGVEHLGLARAMTEHLESEEDVVKMFPQLAVVEDEEVDLEEETAAENETSENVEEDQSQEDSLFAPSSPASLLSSSTATLSLELSDGGLSDLAPAQLEELTQGKTQCFSCRWEIPSSCLPSSCFHCNSPVCPTAPCLTDHLCKLCYTQQRMDLERAEARRKTSQQADKMLELSSRRFGEAEVGTTVLLAIPDVDKGRCEFPNLLCVVLEKSAGGLYKLGCKTGKLESLYSRNQFSPTMTSFLKLEEVDMEREVPVRTAAREESMGGGQGFQKCHCTGKCQTKRCKCKSLGMRCNSRCHNKRSCPNID